jgi:hypothetical protein
MIEYYDFFTGANLTEFWHNMKVLMRMIAPEVLIWFAAYAFYRLALFLREQFAPERDEDYKEYESEE